MVTAEVEEFTVRREHGQDLGVTMGSTLFPSLEVAVMELTANSHDADATRVDITYTPEDDLLIVKDNADGMDVEGIGDFFRLGDSPKSLYSKSGEGRTQIGNFGIATLAVRTLGRRFHLDTFKDGMHYSVTEQFTHKDRDDNDIPIKAKENKGLRTDGTTITLRDLTFTPGDGRFNLEKLREMLREEMPIDLEDFDIYVNKALIVPNDLVGATEYVLDTDDPVMGEVKGSIFCTKRTLKKGRGIYTKVNGRAVGGNNAELVARLQGNIGSRLKGVIHVDGFAEDVKFDRSGFIDGPKKRRLEIHIRKVLKQIRYDMDRVLVDEKMQAARERFACLLPEMGTFLGKLIGDDAHYEFMFDELNAGDLVYVDQETKVVYVNPTASPFRLTGLRAVDVEKSLKQIVEYAALLNTLPLAKQSPFERIAIQIAEQTLSGRKSKTKKYTLQDLAPREDTDQYDSATRISPNRVFTYKEATHKTSFPNALIKRLVTSGVLQDRGGETILGENLVEARDSLEGCVSLYEAVRQVPVPEGIVDYAFFQNREATAINKLASRQQRGILPGYVTNIADIDKEPFYMVRKNKLPTFIEFIETWQFPKADYAE
jgi:hypothetical protein